ncbi:hypothetical protein M885DRAFT_459267 [Pelagophyceae sp. CCMP2097]|nr:hypothetical protein M885DRAFT_459267 [Pelagophyceae sp. CCMP2097]
MALLHSRAVEQRLNAVLVLRGGGEASDGDMWDAVQFVSRQTQNWLPTSHTRDSEMVLAPQHFTDTTDRSLLRNFGEMDGALKAAGGVAGEAPLLEKRLRRDLYYVTPYITCGKCNALLFIDSGNAQTFTAQVDVETRRRRTVPDEVLVVCHGCGTTADLQLGAHDLLQQIAGSKAELLRQLRARQRAASMLCRAYRYYLRRCGARARRHLVMIRAFLVHRLSAVKQAVGRGRLGRRKAVVQGCLNYIRRAHPISLAKALTADGDVYGGRKPAGLPPPVKVFWYKSKEAVTLLFNDYLLLCARQGFVPPRYVTEANVRELARRIRLRNHRLVGSVQARWRALTVRSLVFLYKDDMARIRQVRCAAAFRVCRLYRAWITRVRRIAQRRRAVAQGRLAKAYAVKRADTDAAATLKRRQRRLAQLYLKERAEERTARYCGIVHAGAADGNKMLAFRTSAYGDEIPMDAAKQLTFAVSQHERAAADAEARLEKRGEWLKRRCANDSHFTLYHRDEMQARSRQLISHFSKGGPKKKKAFAQLAVHNNGAGKA